MAKGLSVEDVKRLMEDSSVQARADTAAKVASQFDRKGLSDKEREIAYQIFRVMVKDVEESVRQALAENLKQSPDLPKDVAVSLAKDISDSVALPVIQYSEALDDADLIDIIRTQETSRQVAVASRDSVSENVADTLVEEADKEAVVTLVSNEKVVLTEGTLEKVVSNYGDDADVQGPMIHRPSLPVTVAEKLVARVSDELKKQLVTQHELSDEAATDIILQARERTTINHVAKGAGEEDVERLVAQLHENGRLTASIILRALSTGDLAFFEASLAVMAKVSLKNARILIHDEGELGLKSLYKKAGMPMQLLPAFHTAIKMARNAERERSDADPETQMRTMLEHILTTHEDIVEEYGVENVDYLLRKFNALSHEAMNNASG